MMEEKKYIMMDGDEYIEENFHEVYSRNGTDHLLENDEISTVEEAFMNGWEEADTLE